MRIQFCGASTGVTGSCHLITTEHHKILLDCGQFQGGKAMDAMNYEPFPFDPAEIDYMVLSHAHIDHCKNSAVDKTGIQRRYLLHRCYGGSVGSDAEGQRIHT